MSSAGVEPTAFRLGGERSIQLSYEDFFAPKCVPSAVSVIIKEEPEKIKLKSRGIGAIMTGKHMGMKRSFFEDGGT